MAKSKVEIKVVVVNQHQEKEVIEIVQDRPVLFIGIHTGNVFFKRGDRVCYVKIARSTDPLHRIGWSGHLSNFAANTETEYTGPIDDEMMANIMMYGG